MSKSEKVLINMSDDKQITKLAIFEEVASGIHLTDAQRERLTDLLVDEVIDFVSIPYRRLFMFIFTIGALWGLLTTTLGSTTMLGIAPKIPVIGNPIVIGDIFRSGSIIMYISGLVGGSVLCALGLVSKQIWSKHSFAFTFFKVIWCLGMLFNLYASIMGNAQYLVVGTNLSNLGEVYQHTNSGQLIAIVMLSVVTAVSPIIVSYVTRKSVKREIRD